MTNALPPVPPAPPPPVMPPAPPPPELVVPPDPPVVVADPEVSLPSPQAGRSAGESKSAAKARVEGRRMLPPIHDVEPPRHAISRLRVRARARAGAENGTFRYRGSTPWRSTAARGPSARRSPRNRRDRDSLGGNY